MAVLPIRPAPFFANKNRAFWNLQFAGWGGAMLLRAMSGIANGQPWSFLVLVLIEGVTGFSISLVLSVIYRKLINQRPLITWGATAAVLTIAESLYAFIDAWVFAIYHYNDGVSFANLFLGLFYVTLTLLGAWSALYYAINFYVKLEAQTDQLAQLEIQATSAQLEMLRYQLNPHFLFNTLNSISTLVLLKQTDPANAMLTRLSAFLRHTLVNEPGGKVTVQEEVDTLKLYLDIERMRFEQRLRTEFKIDPAAANASLPSLLLQPLVENAIKYAVSPQEEGAKISVSTRLIGRRLRITVSDTGPGLHSAQGSASLSGLIAASGGAASSTGVGLANIRDRLAQAYGDDHVFEIRTPAQGGFTVVIEIPYEPTEQDTKPASSVGEAKPQSEMLWQRKLGLDA